MSRILIISTEEEKTLIFNYLSYGLIPNFCKRYQKRDFLKKCSSFLIKEEGLFIKTDKGERRYICEFDLEMTELIRENHLPGHIGTNKLKTKLEEEYVGIKKTDIIKFIKNCPGCQKFDKPLENKTISPIIVTEIHQRIMCDLIDFKSYERSNDGYKYIFTLIDCFSKFAFCFALKDKTADTIKKTLEDIFYTEGVWNFLHTDNGREFANKEICQMCEKFGVKIIHGRPRHPQSQGQIERFNRTLKERLTKALTGNSKKWIDLYKDILFQYNNTVHRATNAKPFNIFRNINISANGVKYLNFEGINQYNKAKFSNISYTQKYEKINSTANLEFCLNEKVYLLIDFDNNRRTRRMPLDSIYSDIIYKIISINNTEVEITDDSGLILKVHTSRIKKVQH